MTNPRVLLVDDEPEVLESLALALSRAPDAPGVDTARSAREALEKLAERPYAMILADYRMPEMDGIQLLERVRREHPTLVRGLLTGFHDLDIAVAAMDRAEIQYYLQKPWDTEELRTVVREAVRGTWRHGSNPSHQV